MRRIKHALEDVAWYVRDEGVARAARRVLRLCFDTLSRTIYSHDITIVHSADLASWPDFEPGNVLTMRLAEAADLDRLSAELPPSVIRTFRARFDEGQIMFLAEVGGKLAGYAWMCTKPDSRPARDHGLDLKPGEGVHYGSMTLEDFRRQGIYTALQRFSRAYMRAHGYSRVYGGANIRMPAPVRMMKNLGLRPVQVCHSRRILGRRRVWAEPLPPNFTI
jgi:GNAT superfamily N-acetyltransferase